MKKYYTTISQQPEKSFKNTIYLNPGKNPVLDCDRPVHYPIIPLIGNTAKKGDMIQMIAVKPDYSTTDHCFDVFKTELDQLKADIGFDYGEIKVISTPVSEIVDNHLALFGELVKTAEDNDSIYMDITYGTKPIPMILMMYMNYAYKFCKNINIENIVYGSFDHTNNTSNVYDVSALFYMNSTINSMDLANIEDPVRFIQTLIDM